jgi:hypothetical protein
MSAAPASVLSPFTHRVCALSNASSFASFIQPLSSKPGVTDKYIDTLCECFLSSRKGDIETSAQRFVAFTRAATDHNLSFALDSDIIAGLSLNFILFFAPSGRVNMDVQGRPVIHILPRNIDYSRASVHQMKKTWFFVIMQIALSCPAAQQLGVVVVNNMRDVSRGAFNMEFQGSSMHLSCFSAAAAHFSPSFDLRVATNPRVFKVLLPRPYLARCPSKFLQSFSFTSPACLALYGPSCPRFCRPKSEGASRCSGTILNVYLKSCLPMLWRLRLVGLCRLIPPHVQLSCCSCNSNATNVCTRICFSECINGIMFVQSMFACREFYRMFYSASSRAIMVSFKGLLNPSLAFCLSLPLVLRRDKNVGHNETGRRKAEKFSLERNSEIGAQERMHQKHVRMSLRSIKIANQPRAD